MNDLLALLGRIATSLEQIAGAMAGMAGPIGACEATAEAYRAREKQRRRFAAMVAADTRYGDLMGRFHQLPFNEDAIEPLMACGDPVRVAHELSLPANRAFALNLFALDGEEAAAEIKQFAATLASASIEGSASVSQLRRPSAP